MESSNLILYNLTPDLLDRDALVKILNERCIDLPNMNTMSKDVLVALFHRVVAPLPQRTRSAGQIQHVPTQESRGFSIGFSGATKSSSFQSNSRLKPPPDVCSAQKTVRLATTKSQCSSRLENIIIHDRRKKIVQNEPGKSTDQSTSSTTNGINVLDKIVINKRPAKGKLVPGGDIPTGFENTTEETSKSSDTATHNEGGNVQSSNLKPRIKLKRTSLSAGSGPECSSQLVEPEIKKPKTKIVF